MGCIAAAGLGIGMGIVVAHRLLGGEDSPATHTQTHTQAQAQTPTDELVGPADTVIGEWEDSVGTWSKQILIVKSGARLMRIVTHPDGRIERDYIKEAEPEEGERRRFKIPSSTQGHTYAITLHGHLAIQDNDGYISQALRVRTGEPQ